MPCTFSRCRNSWIVNLTMMAEQPDDKNKRNENTHTQGQIVGADGCDCGNAVLDRGNYGADEHRDAEQILDECLSAIITVKRTQHHASSPCGILPPASSPTKLGGVPFARF